MTFAPKQNPRLSRLKSLFAIAMISLALGCGSEATTESTSTSSTPFDSKSDQINNDTTGNNETVYCVDVCEREMNFISECSGADEAYDGGLTCTDVCQNMQEEELNNYHACISCMESVSCEEAQYSSTCDHVCDEDYEEDPYAPSYECVMYCDTLTTFKETCFGDGPPRRDLYYECNNACDENPLTREVADNQFACSVCLDESSCENWEADCSEACQSVNLED